MRQQDGAASRRIPFFIASLNSITKMRSREEKEDLLFLFSREENEETERKGRRLKWNGHGKEWLTVSSYAKSSDDIAGNDDNNDDNHNSRKQCGMNNVLFFITKGLSPAMSPASNVLSLQSTRCGLKGEQKKERRVADHLNYDEKSRE